MPSFQSVGTVLSGTKLLATVPAAVARVLGSTRPHLTAARLPFALDGTPTELLWQASADDDAGLRFVRDQVVRIAARSGNGA